MCLRVKGYNPTPKIAEVDIPCYKLLKKAAIHYYSIYYGGEIPLEVIHGKEDYYASHSETSYERLIHSTNDILYSSIEQGYIHTYGTATVTDFGFFIEGANAVIFKCIIPKGTEYFEGIYLNDIGYASRKIRFVKEISYPELEQEIKAEKAKKDKQ